MLFNKIAHLFKQKKERKMDYDRLRDNLNMVMAQKPYIYKILTGGNPVVFTTEDMDDNDGVRNFANGTLGGNIRKWEDMSQEERRTLLTNLYAALPQTNEYAEQAIVADMILTRIGAPGYEYANPANANAQWDSYFISRSNKTGGVNFAGAKKDICDAYNVSNTNPAPIMERAAAGDMVRVQRLAEIGADVNVTDNNGDTPLMCALRAGKGNVAAFLIQQGANVNHTNKAGMTPLLEAVTHGQFAIATSLISKGADYNVSTPGENGKSVEMLLLEYREAHPESANDVQGVLNIIKDRRAEQAEFEAAIPTSTTVMPEFFQEGNEGPLTITQEAITEALQPKPAPQPQEVEIEVTRHQYGADKDEHTRAVNQARSRIARSGSSRSARRQRAALGGKVGMQTANNNALANIRAMEEKGLLPKGPGGQSNAEVYLYRLQQARLFYSPDERLEMSDGSRQTADKALGSGDMTFRQVYDALINGQITDPQQLEQLARTIQITEGCINNRGQARTKPIIPVQGQSYSPGADRQVSTLRETLKQAAGQEITEYTVDRDQGLQNAVAARSSGNDGRA